MKSYLILLIVCMFPVLSFSQDLIVTEKGDSLNCKITKEKKDFIYFTFKKGDEIRNTLLAVKDVKTIAYDFCPNAEVIETKARTKEDYKIVRLALSTGYSYRTAPLGDNIPSNLESYYKSLKSGFHVDGHISAYISESFGFGAKYNLYKSSAKSDLYGEEKISINYIGPVICSRLLNYNKTNSFISSFSMGIMSYTNKLNGDYNRINGNTFGMAIDLGYDFGISRNVALGFQLSLLAGTLTKVTYINGIQVNEITLEEEEREGLGPIDFSIGLRF